MSTLKVLTPSHVWDIEMCVDGAGPRHESQEKANHCQFQLDVCQVKVLSETLEEVAYKSQTMVHKNTTWSGHQRQCYTWGVAMVRVVDAGVKGSAQRGLCLRRRGSPAPWPPLIAQLLFSSPLGSSIGKPHLRIQHQLSPMTNTMTNHKHINSWLDIIVPA